MFTTSSAHEVPSSPAAFRNARFMLGMRWMEIIETGVRAYGGGFVKRELTTNSKYEMQAALSAEMQGAAGRLAQTPLDFTHALYQHTDELGEYHRTLVIARRQLRRSAEAYPSAMQSLALFATFQAMQAEFSATHPECSEQVASLQAGLLKIAASPQAHTPRQRPMPKAA